MAVFGTIEDEADAEYRATMAGMEFQKAIIEMNEDRVRAKKDPISIGVGINTGTNYIIMIGLLLAGFIGSSQRLEYTVIGDTVNVSSRVCDQCVAEKVYITESTYNIVKHMIVCKAVGPRLLKGKREEVMLYEAERAKRRNE